MKKIFIDGGAMNGNSVTLFRRFKSDASDYEIHSFECFSPNYDILVKRFPDINIYKEAIWIKNTTKSFYPGNVWSGTLLHGKTTGNVRYDKPVTVNTIDIDQFIRKFDKDDYIVLKLDIEGAEYEVLRHMLDCNTFDYIDELHGEWHYGKIGLDKSIHDNLINDLKKIGIELQFWESGIS
tara:strand:+ start:47 stop:586 length:540 start_codon:yes stop_codon:yes gene_type:complete